jgi:acyl-coenzyme A synthetase/AMP-(fatty) acid ligase
VGSQLFKEFIGDCKQKSDPGFYINGRFASWNQLLKQGLELAKRLKPGQSYLVDASDPFAGFAAFFAVANTLDTFLVWSKDESVVAQKEKVAQGLYELSDVLGDFQLNRPMWAIATSGSSGIPKYPVGFADTLGVAALHYDTAIFQKMLPDHAKHIAHATCLPLQFSATFFMAVLPSIMMQRDLLWFSPHDWKPFCEFSRTRSVVCQSVPAITSAGLHSISDSYDLSDSALILGAGYITDERIRFIRKKFQGIQVANIYGTAETGAISLDLTPGHSAHVGQPIVGKPVWIEQADADGCGLIATSGLDCRTHQWVGFEKLEYIGNIVSSTDHGHFDQDGNLCLDGRVDVGEKLHGLTVYPRVIERHILSLQGVCDVRVLIKREGLKEQLYAKVIGEVSDEELREHCQPLEKLYRPSVFECFSEKQSKKVYSSHGKL